MPAQGVHLAVHPTEKVTMNVSNSLIQLRPLAILRRLTLLLSALVPSLKPRFQTALARFLYWGISFLTSVRTDVA
jgi:hypothetical protein